MRPPLNSSSSIEDSFERVRVNFSSSSKEGKDLNEPKTEDRELFCIIRGRDFGLSARSALWKLVPSNCGLEGLAGLGRAVKKDAGLPSLRRPVAALTGLSEADA